MRFLRWLGVASWLASSGCSLSAGFTDAWAFPTPGRSDATTHNHLGAQGSAYLHLPREYLWVAGAEGSVTGQTGPKDVNDQWRLAGAFGYSRLPSSGGFPVGWEVIGHFGILRGAVGDFRAPIGLHAGVHGGLPIRLADPVAPWQRDGAVQPHVLLVPEIGVGPVLGFRKGDTPRWFIEPRATLNIRLHLTSGLVP